jgi:hypothetical protein
MQDFLINREQNHLNLIKEFEDLEEHNLLLQDFLSQKSTYSTNPTIEIQVKQVVKVPSISNIPIKERMEEPQNEATSTFIQAFQPLNKINESHNSESEQLEELDTIVSLENSDLIMSDDSVAGAAEIITTLVETPNFLEKPKFISRRIIKTKVDAEAQTNPISFSSDKGYVDLMDRATGPDRDIAVYRGVGCQAEFRHPIEDKYDEMKIAYHFLEEEVVFLLC